jgi:hypothetical protein
MAKDERKSTTMLLRKCSEPLLRIVDFGAPDNPERQAQKSGWQLKRIKKVLPILFPPDGRVPSNLTDKAVQRRLVPVFEKNGWKEPSIDSIARARGRRDRRG